MIYCRSGWEYRTSLPIDITRAGSPYESTNNEMKMSMPGLDPDVRSGGGMVWPVLGFGIQFKNHLLEYLALVYSRENVRSRRTGVE